MKKIFKFIILAVTVVTFSCDEYENLVYNGPQSGFVQLSDDAAVNILESSSPVVVEFILDGPRNEAVTVNFDVTADDPARYELTPGTSVVIPAGETSGEVIVTPVNNFDTDGDIDVVLRLAESSSVSVGIGGENVNSVEKRITISDDDCPLDIDSFVGVYSVEEVITGGPNTGLALATAFGEFYQLTLTLDPDDASGTRLIITNNGNEFLPDGTAIGFLSCSGTVQLDPDPVLLAIFANFSVTGSSYTEDTNVIFCEGNLGTSRQYEFTLTKI
jgi:hypothetical protein